MCGCRRRVGAEFTLVFPNGDPTKLRIATPLTIDWITQAIPSASLMMVVAMLAVVLGRVNVLVKYASRSKGVSGKVFSSATSRTFSTEFSKETQKRPRN